MKLPSFRRLFSGDFPAEFKKLIDTLSVSLNNGVEVIYEALNNQLTLRDNIACTVRDITVTVDDKGIPTGTASLKLSTTNKVDGCVVISALNQSNSTVYPSSGVFINFSQSSNILNISHIAGLQPGQSYTLRIVAFTQ